MAASTRDITTALQSSASSVTTGFSAQFNIPYEQLRFGQQLGVGGFATVYEGAYLGQPVAIKQLNKKSSYDIQAFINENKLMQSIASHSLKNSVRYYGYSESSEPTTRNIIMEYIEGGEVYDLLVESAKCNSLMPPETAYPLLEQTAQACAELHEHGIVHGDLKWSNILFTQKKPPQKIKIADFGFATVLGAEPYKIMGCKGTPAYIAPEIISRGQFSCASDIYALGSMMFELGAGYTPFGDKRDDQVMKLIVAGDRASIPAKCAEPLAKLIRLCWLHDPKKRPTAKILAADVQALTESLKPKPSETSIKVMS